MDVESFCVLSIVHTVFTVLHRFWILTDYDRRLQYLQYYTTIQLFHSNTELTEYKVMTMSLKIYLLRNSYTVFTVLHRFRILTDFDRRLWYLQYYTTTHSNNGLTVYKVIVQSQTKDYDNIKNGGSKKTMKKSSLLIYSTRWNKL